VADPGCLSRIPDPDFYPSRIPDPKTATKKRGEKKFVVLPFFCSHKFLKIANYFILLMLKRSEIRKNLSRIPDPGVKKAPDPGSGSAKLLF
jgi:hypothetical protein